MTDDLRDLYQEVILDHYKNPRNYGPLPGADHVAEGNNPLCGDHLTLALKLAGGAIADLKFEGSGCAISKASASLMTAAVKGKSEADVEELFQRFHKMVTGDASQAASLGKLAALSGVSEFPVRVKCASLAWHTLRAALKGAHDPVSTEDPAS
jgi:nitrogen fixation protein NifU and related proteins